MNDIAKKATADRFLKALEKENLSKADAGRYIGLQPPQVSYLFNEKYWSRLGDTYWSKVLAWVNSGYSLREYPRHHPERVIPIKSVDPDAKALFQESVDNVPIAGDMDINAFPEHISEGIPASDNEITDPEFEEDRPPVGLRPRRIVNQDRMIEIAFALLRFTQAYKPIPKEWLIEFEELNNSL
jgi:hypothetical protein